MAQAATVIRVSNNEREQLEGWVRSAKTEQRLAFRARVILAAAGEGSASIARREQVRLNTVSTWRIRFAGQGIAGLQDQPRRGRPLVYGAETEQRVLAKLDGAPPAGHGAWNGRLVAEALGDVPAHVVWEVLRRHGIQLQRRRSWCISSDPEFAPKAAEIVALYLHPPENAVVLSVDEKPHIQALERAQGYLRLPDGKAVRGVSHEYKRHGTTTLFAALNVLTGRVEGMHTQRRRREEFRAFMNEVVAAYAGREIHVVLDNLSTHKPKHDLWLARHPNVHFHFTPTHASWLNQIEVWFSILSRQALKHSSFRSAREVRDRIDAFIQAYNREARPFAWRAGDVHPSAPRPTIADLPK